MSESHEETPVESVETTSIREERRKFLGSLGKWSGACVLTAVGAAAWMSTTGNAQAGWLNRRVGGGGWINGGGSWINRRGGGGWINRR